MTDRERFCRLGELLLYGAEWQRPVARALGRHESWVRYRVQGKIAVKPRDVARLQALVEAHIAEMTELARA